jgi:signal transduction histidine kinase
MTPGIAPPDPEDSFESKLGAILDVAASVLSDLDLDRVLDSVAESARQIAGAQFSALGVMDESRSRLDRFITAGIDEQTRQRIGRPPLGRGVLGELISHCRPLRLDDVGKHPHSYGFPPGHPPMASFLGVPVYVAGEPFGNLYLTNKEGGGSFTELDERAVILMAQFAGIAIDHARRYSSAESQRLELRSTVEALDATVQIAQAVGGETNLDSVLELVAKRGRALVSARALVIERVTDGRTTVAAAAGEVPAAILGREVDSTGSVASSALRSLRTLRLEEDANRIRFQRYGLGSLGFTADCGLVVPLVFRGQGYGVLIAIDRLDDGAAFDADDERLLEAFASSAATAIATAVSAQKERERQRLAATEQERARWARELHDDTLQNLAALRLALSGQRRVEDIDAVRARLTELVDQLDTDIASLRALISDLRPATLDDLGLQAAIEVLADRTRTQGLEVELQVQGARGQARRPRGVATEVETAVYRITQEALSNARRHGGATSVRIRVIESESTIETSISDNGRGFDPTGRSSGFGLIGMRERAEILGGRLEVTSSSAQGTSVRAVLPVERAEAQLPADEPAGSFAP